MATISSIEPQRRGGRVTVFVDDQPWAVVDRSVALELGLRPGTEATDELRERLESHDARHRAHESALLLLSYRQRSESELRQRLQRKGLPEGAVDHAIERLQRTGLIDDAGFARAWVEGRTGGAGGMGSRRLQAELRRKGVPNEVVQQAIGAGAEDEESRAVTVALARAPSLRSLAYQDFRRRLSGFLQRRGFGYEATSKAVRAAWQATRAEEPEQNGE
jgi:regulatory protein